MTFKFMATIISLINPQCKLCYSMRFHRLDTLTRSVNPTKFEGCEGTISHNTGEFDYLEWRTRSTFIEDIAVEGSSLCGLINIHLGSKHPKVVELREYKRM